MKTRLFAVVFSICMMPALSFAMIPTLDMPGSIQAAMETVETTMSKIENSKQVLAMQEMMSKIGSAKAAVSEAINEVKTVVEEKTKKVKEYIDKAKEYYEEAQVYIEAGKKMYEAGKEISEKGIDGYLKDNAGNLMGNAATAMGFDGSKVENFTNNTVNAIETGDYAGFGAGLMGDAATAMGFDGSKVEGFTNQTIDMAKSGEGFGAVTEGLAGNMAGNIAGSMGLDASRAQALTNKAVNSMQATKQNVGVNGLADIQGATPTRQPISGITAKVDMARKEAVALDKASMAKAELKADVSLAKADIASKEAVALDKIGVAKAELKADVSLAKAGMASKEAVALDKASMAKAELKADVSSAKADIASKEAVALDKVGVAKGELKADVSLAKADIASKEAVALDKASMAKAELKADVPLAKAGIEKVKANAVIQGQTAKMNNAKELATKAAQNASKKAFQKTPVKAMPVVDQINKAKALKDISVSKAAASSMNKTGGLKSEPTINIQKEITPVKMQRQQFKSSFGYGKFQNITPLSFASLTITQKSNETAENIMVLPKFISMYCGIDYEEASVDGNMDKCLKKINTVAISSVTAETNKTEIDEAAKDFHNGYVEYLAAAFFEAFDIYNDSLSFKNNELDPFTTTPTNDIDASWTMAKEMHAVLGGRINKLRQLWARTLGMKMYLTYMDERFVEAKEDKK